MEHDDQIVEGEPIASRRHLAIVILVLIGFLVMQTVQLRRMAENPGLSLHRFGVIPFCLFAILMEWVLVGIVWLGIRNSGISIRQLVGGGWQTPLEFLRDAGIGFALWLAWVIPSGIALHYLSGSHGVPKYLVDVMPRTRSELACWLVLSCSAGFVEELVFRGYLQRQLRALTKSSLFAIGCQAILFGALHIYEGAIQVVAIAILGAMLGYLARWRRSLRPGIIMHIWMDALASVIMYCFFG
jgi:membrane protease YdiL (CAAX protease family)